MSVCSIILRVTWFLFLRPLIKTTRRLHSIHQQQKVNSISKAMLLTEPQPNLPFAALGALLVGCSSFRLFTSTTMYFGNENLKKSIRSEMTEEIKRVLTCPISREIMRDPVTIVQSGHTFDREPLCKWLLKNPTKCPATGVDFGEKLAVWRQC